RPRQVRSGAGVEGVGLVPELAVERGGGILSRGGPYSPGVEHDARAALYRNRRIGAELAGDMRIGRCREEREVGLNDRVPPGEPVGPCAAERGCPDRERRLEIGGVLA